MSIAQAGEMIPSVGSEIDCRRPLLLQHDRQLDHESLQQIAALLQQRITPMVAIEAVDEKPWAGHPRHQSESLLCEITGVSHLFGGETGLMEAVQGLLTTMGLHGRMAIAPSVGAAWALSHHGKNSLIVPPGALQQAIRPLAVQSLRICPATVATLARLGVERVHQLLQLPRSGLASRLGSALVRRIEQLLGEVEEPLGVYHAPAEHSQSLALEYPTSDQKIIADRIERLIKKVRAGLAACQRGALRMACRLDLSVHPPLTLEIGLFAPSNDTDHLSGLMIHRLEAEKLPACVERLTISVTLSGPLRSVQTSLFDNHSYDANSSTVCMSGSELSRLIDSLSGRLGRDAVVGVKMEDDPLPEKAFSASPLAGNPHLAAASTSTSNFRSLKTAISSSRFSPHASISNQNLCRKQSADQEYSRADSISYRPSPDDAMRRPLCLLTQPVPLAVAFENGPFHWNVSSPKLPARLRLAGVIHLITAHWGPERIESGWWKGPSVRRDYYRIETDQGRWWWIFRNLSSKTQVSDTNSRYRWMLHGRFT